MSIICDNCKYAIKDRRAPSYICKFTNADIRLMDRTLRMTSKGICYRRDPYEGDIDEDIGDIEDITHGAKESADAQNNYLDENTEFLELTGG